MIKPVILIWTIILFIWSAGVQSAPIGNKRLITREEGTNPIFNNCSRLPFQNQVEACNDFMTRLNPAHPELLDFVDHTHYGRLRNVLREVNREKQFVRFQLVTEPSSLAELLENADGETAFILDSRYGEYALKESVVIKTSFALVGAIADRGDMKPCLTMSGDFDDMLVEMFELKFTDPDKRAIFSNLVFNPQYSGSATPSLEFIIQAPASVDYLVIDQVDFFSSGVKGHPLRGLVSLNNLTGVANIVGSSMELSNVSHYGVMLNACPLDLANGCEATLRFNGNLATAPKNSGLLQIKNVQDFHAEQNQLTMSQKASFTRDDQPVSVFSLIYEAMPGPVAGLFSLNSIDGCSRQFPFSTITSASGESLPGVRGQVVFNKNNYGDCRPYQQAETLPALVQTEQLPESLRAILAEVSSSLGLPVVSSVGEPELSSSVISLAREIMATASSEVSDLSTSIAQLSTSPDYIASTPTPSPSFSSASTEPHSTFHWSSASSPGMYTTSVEPSSSPTSINPTSSSSAKISPTSTYQSTTTVLSSSFYPSPSVSPSPSPSSGSGSGSGSGIVPSPTTSPMASPTVLPPKPKKLSRGSIAGIVLGSFVGMGALAVEVYLIRQCVRKYSNPGYISTPWNIVTLGFCACLVKQGGSNGTDRGYQDSYQGGYQDLDTIGSDSTALLTNNKEQD